MDASATPRPVAPLARLPPRGASVPPSPVATPSHKQKARRSAVTEEQDVAILRAAVKLRPQHATWGHIKRSWQQVADAVVAEVGGDGELTHLACQRRYETLVERFLVRRETRKNWPPNRELRKLLELAAADQKNPKSEASSKTAETPRTTPRGLRALAPAASTKRGNHSDMDDHESLEDGEVREHPPTDSGVARTDTRGSTRLEAPSGQLNGQQSFVESTLGAVLDRLARFQSTWLENEREEREFKERQLALERDVRALRADGERQDTISRPPTPEQPTRTQQAIASSDGITPHPADAQTAPLTATLVNADASKTPPSGPVPATTDDASKTTAQHAEQESGLENASSVALALEFEELQQSVSELAAILTASTVGQLRLSQQIVSLATMLSEVREENEALKQDVTTLQALHRDAASLAATIRSLGDAHKHHKASFETLRHQQDALVDALTREVKERYRLILNQVVPLKNAAGVAPDEDQIRSFLAERERLRAGHRQRLAEFDQKLALLEGPVNVLKTAIEEHQRRLHNHASTMEATKTLQTKTRQALAELRSALEREREDRDKEYDVLLNTIEHLAAG